MSEALHPIVDALRRASGDDASIFDPAFFDATVGRRLQATASMGASEYALLVASSASEREALLRALYNVTTEFFRDPLTFALLEHRVLPALFERAEREGRKELRVWSAACAAGHEAYSIAILLDEARSAKEGAASYRIFATDLSEVELETARRGVYDVSALGNVRLAHLRRSFAAEEERYRVDAKLSSRIEFSRYDLLDDRSTSPPGSIFGDFDLVLCCNVLFYYREELRQGIVRKLLKSLAPGGYLVTGEAESAIVASSFALQAVTHRAAVFKKPANRGEPCRFAT